MLKQLLLSALLVGGTTSAALADRDHEHDRNREGMTDLGMRAAEAGTKSELVLGDTGTRFHSLTIDAVKGVPIVDHVFVYFADGEHQDVDLGAHRLEASAQRVDIPLRGGARDVTRIVVQFARDSSGKIDVSAQ
jgi:hypothetical protein